MVVGVAIGVATLVDARLRIADEAPLALLVCVSGAVAGWALLQVLGVADDAITPAALAVPFLGGLLMAVEAWRGRRRTFSELGLHPHSD